jgi:hypothetical protein
MNFENSDLALKKRHIVSNSNALPKLIWVIESRHITWEGQVNIMRSAYKYHSNNLKRRDPGLDGRISLKVILIKYGQRVWIGSICPRVRSSGRSF